jgi:phage protein D
VLVPAYRLTFNSRAADTGGIVGATAGSAQRAPAIGSAGAKVIDTTDQPQASTAVDLTVALDLDTPADSFTLLLGNVGSFTPARDDEARIELGYADNGGLTQVITGTVVTVEPDLTITRVVGYSGADLLLRTFVEQTYEGKTAGAIVCDLSDKAGVDVAPAEDGIAFPAYVIDGRRSAWEHMRDLADLCGVDLYINSDGKLIFEKFVDGKIVHVFEFTKHIIELEVLRRPAVAGLVQAWGESPTGSAGEDAWAWLTTDFSGSKGIAGSGKGTFLLERAPLRTIDAARTAANAALTDFQRRRLRGRLVTIGRPQVKLGDAIRLRGMADESLNTAFQVRSVTHRITKRGGFTTTVGFRAIET